MRPTVQWRGITLPTYPVMLYLGLVAGLIAGNDAARALRVDPGRVSAATMFLIPPALAAARALYVALHWNRYYRHHPESLWDRRQGGMAMYGGLPVMLLLSIPITGALGIPLGSFWDAAIFTILLGIAFTKLGCYLNGCCTGRGIWRARFPAQLLEAAWAALLTILAAAAVSWRLPPYPGALFLMAGGMYASGRLVFENLRESEPGGTPRAGVVFSIALLVLSAAVHFVQQSR